MQNTKPRITDYYQLSENNQERVREYTETLLKIQKAEEDAAAKQEKAERKSTEPACSFCGKPHSEVPFLIVGKTGNICTNCLEICTHIVDEVTSEA